MKKYPVIRAFDELSLLPELLTTLDARGYKKPMPVQAKGLAPLLGGESAIVRARTGTGKTALFGLPILQAVQKESIKRALILAPTRELGHQIAEELGRLAERCGKVEVASLVGGKAVARQAGKLASSNVLIMTPGRALDALENNRIDPREIGAVVVDEADHMLEVGSLETCAEILQRVVRKSTQLVFCSATFSDEIRKMCGQFRREMADVTLSARTGDHGNVVEWAIQTYPERHIVLCIEILRERQPRSCIVFCNHRERVDEVAAGLDAAGFSVAPLHGDLDQKERNAFMDQFRDGECKVMVATNLAARGIDVPGLELVINYDLPYDVTDYVHRYGRTGRAGRDGMVVSFYNGRAVRRVRDIESRTGRDMRHTTFAEIMKGKSTDASGAVQKIPKLTPDNCGRLFINCGRKNGMTFGALKSMLTGECGLKVKKEVLFMDIQDDCTIIGVFEKKFEATFKALSELSVQGRQLRVDKRDAPKPSAPAGKKTPSGPRIGKSRVNKPKRTKPPRGGNRSRGRSRSQNSEEQPEDARPERGRGKPQKRRGSAPKPRGRRG